MNAQQLKVRLGDAVVEGDAAAPAARVLAEAPVGYLGMAGEGWPYVVPISFAPDGDTLFFHGGGSLKASLLEADGRVCLAVTTLPGFLAAGDPCSENFSTSRSSRSARWSWSTIPASATGRCA